MPATRTERPQQNISQISIVPNINTKFEQSQKVSLFRVLQEGAVICDLAQAAEDGTTCLEVDGFPILLLRHGGELRAFVNACPHQYLPLDHKSDRLLSADGTRIRCSNHSAGFDAQTGEGVEGLGLGACLDPVPVSISRGQVIIG